MMQQMKLPITNILKSNLYDYNDAFNVVTGDITVVAAPEKQVAFKNCTPFTKGITKIDETTIDDAENIDLALPIFNLIGYSSNYSKTTGTLWFYSKDETSNFNHNIANSNNFKSFKYKSKLLGNTEAQTANAANGILKNATIAVPLKYSSNFWRSREKPLINCKVELNLRLAKYCAFSLPGTENYVNDNYNADNMIFTIKHAKFCVPIVTFSKDLKDQFIGMNIKQKVIIKIQQPNLDIFSNQILLEKIDYSF